MYRLVVIDDEYIVVEGSPEKNWSMKWWDALMMESMGWK